MPESSHSSEGARSSQTNQCLQTNGVRYNHHPALPHSTNPTQTAQASWIRASQNQHIGSASSSHPNFQSPGKQMHTTRLTAQQQAALPPTTNTLVPATYTNFSRPAEEPVTQAASLLSRTWPQTTGQMQQAGTQGHLAPAPAGSSRELSVMNSMTPLGTTYASQVPAVYREPQGKVRSAGPHQRQG